MNRFGLAVVVLVSGVAPGARAQAPARARAATRFSFSAALGLARRQDQPWTAIHLALAPSGWDAFYPVTPCIADCQERPSRVAEGFPLTLTVAARARLGRFIQLRLFAGAAPLGHYPGQSGTTQLAITPSATVAGLQGVFAWHGLWAGVGPTINVDRVRERAGPAGRSVSGTRAGLGVSVGAMLGSRGRWYGEVAVERRMAGAVDLLPLPVPGEPVVPGMRVSLSHTLLTVGVGWRR